MGHTATCRGCKCHILHIKFNKLSTSLSSRGVHGSWQQPASISSSLRHMLGSVHDFNYIYINIQNKSQNLSHNYKTYEEPSCKQVTELFTYLNAYIFLYNHSISWKCRECNSHFTMLYNTITIICNQILSLAKITKPSALPLNIVTLSMCTFYIENK